MNAHARLVFTLALVAFVLGMWTESVRASESAVLRITYLPLLQRSGASLAAYRLLLLSNREGPMHLYAMRGDGSELRRLSNLTAKSALWSPDGTRVLFTHAAAAGDDLYLVDSDGTNSRPLVTLPGDEYASMWSPDSGRMLFLHDHPDTENVELFVTTNADPRPQLIDSNPSLRNAQWAPDGLSIAYTADGFPGDPELLRYEVFVFDMVTSQRRQVTNGAVGFVFEGWLEGGKKLLVSEDYPDDRLNLHTVTADGSELLAFTTSPGAEQVHAISDDGTRVAYSLGIPQTNGGELYVRSLTDSVPLLASEPFCYNAVCGLESARFAADGKEIVYITWQAGSAQNCPSDLWLATATGTTPEWSAMSADVYAPLWLNPQTLMVHRNGGPLGAYARTPYIFDLLTGAERALFTPDTSYNSVLDARYMP